MDIKRDSSGGLNIAVSSAKYIDNKFGFLVQKGNKIDTEHFDREIVDKSPLYSMLNHNLEKKIATQVLSPSLREMDQRAKSAIRTLRNRIGLPDVAGDTMKCAYFTDEEFTTTIGNSAFLYGMENAIGGSNDGLRVEIVRMHDFPDYFVGSIAYHELIHRFIDSKVRIFTSEPRDERLDVVRHDLMRVGLQVQNAEKKEVIGALLNELGNYYEQMQLIRQTRNDPDLPLTLKSDFDKQEALTTERYGKAQHLAIKISLPSGRSQQVAFARDTVQFDNREDLIPLNMMCFFQLTDDINLLCGNVDGQKIMDLVVKAKTDPKLQNMIAGIMNAKIEPGFYNKLKHAKYLGDEMFDGVFDVLTILQSKIYTFSE